MESPELYNLTRIRWQFFGTLTFRAASVPEKTRLSMWFAVGRKTARTFRVYFPATVWCLRQEDGETTGRRHFHFLLGGLPQRAVTIATCMSIRNWWQSFHPVACVGKDGSKYCRQESNPHAVVGGGMARVRLFNPALNGVDYVTGCLGGGDVYESAKFGGNRSGLMLSKGAEAMLLRIIREERRHVKRIEKMGQQIAPGGSGCSGVCP